MTTVIDTDGFEQSLDDLFDPPRGPTLSKRTREKGTGRVLRQEERLREMQDEILGRAFEVVEGALAFHEIPPGSEAPPEEWVERYGQEKAEKRHRLAQYATLSAKNAPVGIGVAKSVMTGILSAQAKEKSAPRTLNVAKVILTTALPQFDEIEVEK